MRLGRQWCGIITIDEQLQLNIGCYPQPHASYIEMPQHLDMCYLKLTFIVHCLFKVAPTTSSPVQS